MNDVTVQLRHNLYKHVKQHVHMKVAKCITVQSKTFQNGITAQYAQCVKRTRWKNIL